MDSVTSLMAGGVAFSTQTDSDAIAQAAEKTIFKLYKTEDPEIEERITFDAPMKLYFDNGVKGLSVGASVEFKGLRVGTVVDIGVETSSDKKDLLTFAVVEIEPQRLPADPIKDLSNAQRLKNIHKFFEIMINQGMRAQLQTGNLLTGQSLVALDIFPSIEKGKVKYVDGVLIMPTVPEALAGILDKVNAILARLEAMPLEEMGRSVEETTASINKLIKSLNAVEGGMVGVQISEAIVELTRAARAMRSMAEYLERHPEALLRGKSDE